MDEDPNSPESEKPSETNPPAVSSNDNSIAAATASTVSGDGTIAQALYTVEALTNLFGFDIDVANIAVQEVGTDVTACYNYILDSGLGEDKGGAIHPIDSCPHVSLHVKVDSTNLPKDPQHAPCSYFADKATGMAESGQEEQEQQPARAKDDDDAEGTCPLGENWCCLECGKVRCSRYVNGHGLVHWKETKTDSNPDGHCIAISLADLSVWCHVCSAYLKHSSLDSLVTRLEKLKFPSEPETKRARSSLGEDTEEEGQEEKTQEANARGVPIRLDDEEEDEDDFIHYPFESPTSLEDVANFIMSDSCQNIMVLAGAGMSVRSGIPDFRSANGLYATMNPDLLTADSAMREAIREDPSLALDHRLFITNPFPCLELNRSFLLGTREQRWKATLAHRFVELLHSKLGKLRRLYTQNIDGLEDQCTKLPREKVVNVHGTMDRAECALCLTEGDFDTFCDQVQRQIKDLSGEDPTAPNQSTPIKCKVCGHDTMKPAITLFRSTLPVRFFELLPQDIPKIDLLIVMGTSLRVAPANTLVFRVPETAMRVIINRDPVGIHLGVDYRPRASRDYFAQGDIDPTCLALMKHLGWLEDLEPLLAENKLPESSAQILRESLEKLRVGDNTSYRDDS